ncbi:MAG: alanine racemase [Chloroflexi bacterium]|nr:alanine racemase [Chloroflexota bacterium]
MWQGRPLWAEIDLDAIAHNIRELKRHIGERPELLAVVKANSYGLGAVAVSPVAVEAGATRLGVACVDEGIQLRQAGIQTPILILGYTPAWEADAIVAHGLTPTVTTLDLARALARFSEARGVVTPVHVKVDTGMGRFGLLPADVAPFAESVRAMQSLRLEGIYTHFASADEADKAFTMRQANLFLATAEALPDVRLRHMANSATVLDLPDLALDMARPGVSLYGCYPSRHVTRKVSLRPALSLKSRVARLTRLAPGDTVSYGRTWSAGRESIIALVSCGYADGLPRLLSNRGHVLIGGHRVPIVGRICMDLLMADVTDMSGVQLDQEVVIIGRQGDAEIPVEEVAEQADTVSYEIICRISARVPRVYVRDGRVVRVSTLNGQWEPALE